MLAQLATLATGLAGLANAPWWFWIVGAMGLAVLSMTDPRKVHPRYADGGISEFLMLDSAVSFTAGCVASAGAFMAGRLLAWLL